MFQYWPILGHSSIWDLKFTFSIIRNRLNEDDTLSTRTKLSVDDIMELLEFILTTTYFSFRNNSYRQKFGAAMGSPVSAIIANMFMEWLEKEAIASAPMDCRPKIWRRYVDDVLEVIKSGTTQKLTDHLNTVDPTGSIKFTHEEESEGKIPFLDTLIVRKPDGTVKLLVYRKKTHTDQYLNFDSQHPLHQKLGVIRTLMDRKKQHCHWRGGQKGGGRENQDWPQTLWVSQMDVGQS